MDLYDLIIIGSGAAGLSAAVYAARYRLKLLVIGENFGGETALAGRIENYPGFKAVDGFKQDITAAATGAVAATSAYEDHKIHGDLCPWHMRPAMDK
ncbi:NAD(P)/FAD-dependent oxidoreductase [Candidatus Peregrinibacteria bacterium]|nr:NAD(P)/FAD-dependent oxidoreductase [Candidatus Peregrinibacteria bacterium]